MVLRFMKGVRTRNPPKPRYNKTWDTNMVVNLLRDYDTSKLKKLTLKLTMLLALVTAQRAQTLSVLKIEDMVDKGSDITFNISSPLKTKQANTTSIELKSFTGDARLCIVTTIRQYLERTKDLRSDNTESLLISWIKPFKPVHVDTIRRWILCVMQEAGVDINEFKAHTTRSAAASRAHDKNVPLESILKAGMWSKENTFYKFYCKDIQPGTDANVISFQDAVLTDG